MKRHFDNDLARRVIVANREAEIRRRQDVSPGQETDIQIDAIRQADSSAASLDVITAIVEVNGNWHAELWTAMETQLVHRYLADNHLRHGLYLVGWFACTQWDDADRRKRAIPKIAIDEAQERLAAQAKGLSRDGRNVAAFVLDTRLR